MKLYVRYEWALEELDEFGDIVDTDFTSDLPALPADWSRAALALVCRYGNDLDGEQGRAYAYADPDTMTLPADFDDGRAVPKKYHEALCKGVK